MLVLEDDVQKYSERHALTSEEEGMTLDLVNEYAHYGHEVTSNDIKDAVDLPFEQMNADLTSKLPFKNAHPGNKFIRGFKEHHKKSLAYSRALRQEGRRFGV